MRIKICSSLIWSFNTSIDATRPKCFTSSISYRSWNWLPWSNSMSISIGLKRVNWLRKKTKSYFKESLRSCFHSVLFLLSREVNYQCAGLNGLILVLIQGRNSWFSQTEEDCYKALPSHSAYIGYSLVAHLKRAIRLIPNSIPLSDIPLDYRQERGNG